jgi:hypothetical protein
LAGQLICFVVCLCQLFTQSVHIAIALRGI